MKGYFVTGTDTGVGKTRVAAGLLRAFRERGQRVAGMKPVASGSVATADGLRNADALILQGEASVRHPYAVVNPCAYEPAIAPHLAAEEAGRPVDFVEIIRCFRLLAADSDVVVVEGAGGWRAPLAGQTTIGDLAAALDLPVVLVVGLRLGCLNHAILTAEAIVGHGLLLAGWVGNAIDSQFGRVEDTLATLQAWLPAPLIGVLPHEPGADAHGASGRLAVELLC